VGVGSTGLRSSLTSASCSAGAKVGIGVNSSNWGFGLHALKNTDKKSADDKTATVVLRL